MEELSNSLGFYIRVIVNELDRRINLVFRDWDLTKSQADIIRFLCSQKNRDQKVRQRDIEDFFHVSNPTVTGILNRLEAKDIIRRVPSETDRRIHFIEPTERASELQQEIYHGIQSVEAEMLEGIPPQLRDEGMEFLRMIVINVLGKGKENKFAQNSCCSDQAV